MKENLGQWSIFNSIGELYLGIFLEVEEDVRVKRTLKKGINSTKFYRPNNSEDICWYRDNQIVSFK